MGSIPTRASFEWQNTSRYRLGFTLVRLSQTARGLDETASKQARFNAEQVIETVKNFRNRLKDDERAREIEQRLAELEGLVLALSEKSRSTHC